jgi:hypothetical protein
MSNHLAIATVTAVVRKTLQNALDDAEPTVSGARVTTTRPNAPAADLPNPGVNVFLYQTTPSAALRNLDLPSRRGDMTVVQRPQTALDLHYLITFHGADARLEPQVLHGIVTRSLHERPVMTRAMIEATLADPAFAFLQGSDLADAVEMARFSPIGLSVEEMSKLWSVFFQTPYVLSIAYRASVVLIESELPAQSAPPVRSTRVRARLSTGPVVARVVAAAGEAAPISSGQEIIVTGENLAAAVTRVRFGELEVAPEPDAISPTRVRVLVPAALPAGVQGVQIVHRRTGEPSSTETASNTAAFVLQPLISVQKLASAVRVNFTPPVGRTQRVVLVLNEMAAPAGRDARGYTFVAPPRPATAPATSATVDIPFADVPAGDYLVRVQVDGAESPLGYNDAARAYTTPKLTLP